MDPKLKKLIVGALGAGLTAALAYFASHLAAIQPDPTPAPTPVEVAK